jgi:DNA-binding MarR family transcriptional regulator
MSQDALSQDNVDAVDRIIEQWKVERPDLDPSAKAVTGRIVRLASIFQRRFGEAFTHLELTEGDYGVLVALRRSGDPFELTPTELARTRMMTSGGMTAVIDRLDRRGLLERLPNPADRRGSIVRLTGEGRSVIDRAMEAHTAVEHELIAALDDQDRDRLASLLGNLLRSNEPGRPGTGR